MCVVGKNYRLQNIQLSKNPAVAAFGSSGATGPLVANPSVQRGRQLVAPGRSAAIMLRREKLVENTGLEPVTSWLQTRRSPS